MLKYLKTLNALFVEDELEIQHSLKESLQYFFKDVYVASNGLEALKILKSNSVHCVFTDYEMPYMNGYELTKEIRTFNKNLSISIISNHDDREKLQQCIPLKLDGYLFKPLTYKKLKEYLMILSKTLVENGILEYKITKNHKLDLMSYELYENTTIHKPTKLEVEFLKLLYEQDGKVATFEYLEELLFGFNPSATTFKNTVYRIKTKYNITNIKSIRDIGYILVCDA